ncbi:MAG: glycosyltransferase family 4 protein, partial [Immundisolibacteraceae bacterium]|nr:glycosyltransferase family 4 protein [Immundisolibacteraceae bacterium]
MSKKKVLVVTSGLYFNPESSQVIERFDALSKSIRGDVLFINSEKVIPSVVVGGFSFRALTLPMWVRELSIIRNPLYWLYILFYGLKSYRSTEKYDAIWVQDPFNIGVMACLVKMIFGVPIFMEVIGNLERSIDVDSKDVGILGGIKSRFMKFIAPKTLNYADSVRLVYPTQLDFLESLVDKEKYSSYAGFVPTRLIEEFESVPVQNEYILLIGGPWYLKGVDLLITAFNNITDDFPDLHLQIVGYEPAPGLFEKLAGGSKKIVLNSQGVDYGEVMALMAGCKIFVLASRTEAYARVLTETMISKKPLVASAVDGVPHYIEHHQNGLLFESENAGDLEIKLRELLNSPALCEQIAVNGYQYAKENIT